MDSKQILITVGIAVIASLVVTFGAGFLKGDGQADFLAQVGAPGGRLIEQYLPVIQYNNGLKTAKPIWTTGSSTVEGIFDASGAVNVGGDTTMLGDLTVDTSDFIVDISANVVSIGTTTPNANNTFQVDGGTATGTISADSSTDELFGGCLELKSMVASTTFHMFATTSSFAFWQPGSCEGGGGGFD